MRQLGQLGQLALGIFLALSKGDVRELQLERAHRGFENLVKGLYLSLNALF